MLHSLGIVTDFLSICLHDGIERVLTDVTAKLQNRHPTPCRGVDGTNDHNVVALDGTLPNTLPAQLRVKRRECQWLASLAGETNQHNAVSRSGSGGLTLRKVSTDRAT